MQSFRKKGRVAPTVQGVCLLHGRYLVVSRVGSCLHRCSNCRDVSRQMIYLLMQKQTGCPSDGEGAGAATQPSQLQIAQCFELLAAQ